MKKKFGLFAFAIVTFFSLVGTAIGSISWFVASVVTPEYKINGSSAGAYFAYGDGKPYEEQDGKIIHRPFGISIGRHLYNLAWLQYMGQFDDDQYYFEIAESVSDETGIDMSGYILPPIGTEDDPFVGNFNGNGKVIKNLTVTNDEAKIFSSNRHPDAAQVVYEEPEIVGLFGVVGNYGSSYKGTYDSQINSIYNLGITDLTVETTTSKALVGIAAGYVDAEMSNVVVNDSGIDIKTSNTAAVDAQNLTENLSDFGVVGYATDSYRKNIKTIEQDLYDINIVSGKEFNATDQGSTVGWGGSIDMNSLYTRLNSIRGNNGTTDYPFTQTINHLDNEVTSTTNNSNQSVYRFKGYGNSDNPNTQADETTTDYRGSIAFGYSDTNDSDSGGGKHYLVGGTYQTHNYYSSYEHTGTMIKFGNTNNKLTVTAFTANGGTIGNITGDSPVLWELPTTNGRIYTTYDNGNNGSIETYYLYNNNGQLALTTNNGTATNWYKTTNQAGAICYATTSDKNGGYYINFNGNNWVLTALSNTPTTPAQPRPDPNNPVPQPTEPTIPHPGNPPEAPEMPLEPTNAVSYGVQLYYTTNNGTIYFVVPNANLNDVSPSTEPFNGGWTYDNNRITLTQNTGYRLLHPNNANGNASVGTSNQDNRAKWTRSGNNGSYVFTASGNRYLRYNGTDFESRTTNSQNTFSMYEWKRTYDGKFMLGTEADEYTNQKRTDYLDDLAQYEEDLEQHNVDIQQYNSDLAAYNAAWAQYNSDLAAYNDYVAAVNAWNTYDTQTAAHNTDISNSFRLSQEVVTADNPIIGPDYHQTSEDVAKGTADTRMHFTYEDTSYFPINVDSNNQAKLENTGYFVAGSTSNTFNTGTNCPRSLIFSSYSKTAKIRGYDNTNKVIPMNQIYTVDFNNNNQLNPHVIDSTDTVKYSKLADSKAGLEAVLANKTNVGGFHFYAAGGNNNPVTGFIDTNSIVEARDVRMKGNEYRTYELPVYALDFYLKEKGRVNFLAGMYNGGGNYGSTGSDHMNGFFSLFRVLRDSNEHITDIREVQAIYGNENHQNWSYIYEYKNGKFSKPYRISVNNKYEMSADDRGTVAYQEDHDLTSISTYLSSPYGYTKLFDNDWLGYYNYDTNYSGCVFYFEIPSDEGEYCLGRYQTPSGRTMDGAYLMYLDIGANAAKTQRTIFYEHFKEIRKMFEYPAGVAVVSMSTMADNITNQTALDEKDTALFFITGGTSGTVAFSRSGNDVELSRSGGLLTSAKPTLVGDLMWDSTHQQYNIHNPGGSNLSDEIVSIDTVTDVRRLEYYDYNVNLNELMITHIIDTSTDDGTTWTRTFYQQYSDGTSTTEVENMKIYDTATGVKHLVSDLTNPTTSPVKTYSGNDESSVNNDILIAITYSEDNGENIVYNWKLEVVVGEGTGTYYVFNDYVFEATLVNGEVTLTVIELGSKTIKINNTTITQNGQTVTIVPVNP